DLSWNETGEEAVHNYKKGDEIEAVVLAVDPERERISLGVKQIDRDPFGQFVADNPKGSIVKGIVKEVDAKQAVIDLGDGVEGVLRASEISRERVEDVRQHYKEGDEVESKFIGTDRKSRMLSLSIKAKDYADEAEAMSDYNDTSEEPAGTTLGDLLKEQMNKQDK
ncbi:MAG: small subunit ribosomal protein S1, partial [Halioglobus sp.]